MFYSNPDSPSVSWEAIHEHINKLKPIKKDLVHKKKKLILEKVEIIVLNLLDAVLVLTAAKVVITAAAHSVALNDHREKAHTLLTP